MTVSSTAIAYFLLTVTIVFMDIRFFQYWKEKRDTTSKVFFLFGLSLLFFGLIRVITALFFAENTQVLKDSVVVVAFVEGLAGAIVAFLVVYLKIPKISPWIGFFLIFILGLVITFMSAAVPYEPFVDSSGAIDWGFPKAGGKIFYPTLRLLMVVIAFLPLMVILFQQFIRTNEAILKRRSLGLFLSLLLAIGVGFIDFVLNDILKLGVIYRDYTLIVLAIILFFVILFTQRPEQSKNPNV